MEELQYMEIIIESIDVPIMVLSKDLEVVSINEKATEQFELKLKKGIRLALNGLAENNYYKDNQGNKKQNCSDSVLAETVKKIIESNETMTQEKAILAIMGNDLDVIYWKIEFSARKIAILPNFVIFTFLNIEKKRIESTFDENKNEKETGIPFFYKIQAEKCYLAMENAPFELLFTDHTGKVLYANKIAKNSLSIASDNTGVFYLRDINPSISEEWWKMHYYELQEKKHVRFETNHLNSEGYTTPVRVDMFLLEKADEITVCYISYDNSDQYKIQETLLKESRKNESLAEISNELSFHNSLDSIVILVRQYALEITESLFCFLIYEDPANNQIEASIYSDTSENYKEQAFMIESSLRRHYGKLNLTQDELRSAYSEILNDKNEFQSEEISFLDSLPFSRVAWTGIFFHEGYKGLLFVAGKNSEYLCVEMNHLKSLASLFGVAVNRIQEKIRLLNNMEQLELALDVANMGVWNIYPMENKLIFDHGTAPLINRIGFPHEISINDTLNYIHHEDIQKAVIVFNEHINSNSSFFRLAIRIKNIKNIYWWYEISGRVISRTKSGEIERVTGVIMDINNTMTLTQELTKSKEEAIQANKAKGAFLARISHEMRTPLNAIIGFTDILINKTDKATQTNYLQNIKTSGMRLINLINDVLDLAKIESGILVLKSELVELKPIVKDIYNMMELLAEQKRLAFRIEISDRLPDFFFLDEVQFRQILINLLSNAIKFTEIGFIELKIDGNIISENECDLIISVTDTGIGIKPESQTSIFEDFFQQEDQDNRRYGGTGLGLGIVKRIVKLMEGSINLESEPGNGSRFIIFLPKRKVDKIQSEMKSTSEISTYKPITTKKLSDTAKITDECRQTFNYKYRNEWEQFKIKPSFKSIPLIVDKLNSLAFQFQDYSLKTYNLRLKDCLSTFDVEELNQIIKEITEYTK